MAGGDKAISFSKIIHLNLLALIFAKLLQNENIFAFRDKDVYSGTAPPPGERGINKDFRKSKKK